MLGIPKGSFTNLGVGSATLCSAAGSSSTNGNGNITSQIPNVPVGTNLITVEIPINDFRFAVPLGALGDTSASVSFYGALYNCCNTLATNFPNAAIYLITDYGNNDPAYAGNWGAPNASGVYLNQFRQAMRDVGNMFGIPVINAGEGSQVGGARYATQTLYTDNIHPNDFGGVKFASYIAGVINGTPTAAQVPAPLSLAPLLDGAKCNMAHWQSDTLGNIQVVPTLAAWEAMFFTSAIHRLEFDVAPAPQSSSEDWIAIAGSTGACVGIPDGNSTPTAFKFTNTNVNGVSLTGVGARGVRTRADLSGGTVTVTASADGGLTFPTSIVTAPTIAMSADANQGPILSSGLRLGIISPGSITHQYLVYNVELNSVPLAQILETGVIPA